MLRNTPHRPKPTIRKISSSSPPPTVERSAPVHHSVKAPWRGDRIANRVMTPARIKIEPHTSPWRNTLSREGGGFFSCFRFLVLPLER